MSRWLLKLWARWVPLVQRDRWVEEWQAELAALESRDSKRSPLQRFWTTTRFSWGARAHAFELARLSASESLPVMMMMTTMMRDLRFAVRSFRRTPGFTVVAIATLALGIGASTTMFSVLDAVVLRPLPYSAPDELVMVGSTSQRFPGLAPASPADFNDWREQSASFSHLIATEGWTLDLTDADRPTRISSAAVSGGFFEMLGAVPMLGRGITPEDDTEGAEPVVVISHGLWERRYGSDPGVVESRITTADQTFTVVGVMPETFEHPEAMWSDDVDIYMPTSQTGSDMTTRNGRFLQVMGRLSPGTSLFQARQEMSAIASALAEQYPQNIGRETLIEPLQSETIGDVGRALTLLTSAVGLLLLIACVNVANLFMARASDRAREIAVRTALGAGRARIRAQMLTEGVVLSLVGGFAGIGLAYLGVSVFRAVNPAGIPRVEAVSVDARILAFAVLLSVATGIAFATAPALRLGRSGALAALRSGVRAGGAIGGQRFRNTLVAVELGLAVELMIGAGLFVNSFLRLQSVDPGFDAEDAVTMAITLNSRYESAEQQVVFFEQLLDGVSAQRGVVSAAYTSALPLAGESYLTGLNIEGREVDPANRDIAEYSTTSPGFFSTMGMDVVGGRDFTRTDDASAEGVLLVNEAFALRYWPGEDPLGKRISLSRREPVWQTVIGVVEDVSRRGLDEPAAPEIYRSPPQSGIENAQIVVRTDGDMAGAVAHLRRIVGELDPTLPIEFGTLEGYVARSVNQSQFYTQLFSAFALMALVLAGVGVYGTMSYTVGQRTRELGIRLALGAEAAQVTGMVARQGLAVAAVGLAGGLIAATAGARIVESFLFDVGVRDPVTYLAGVLVLALVAMAACWIPARRAGRSDPVRALRME